MERFPIWRLSLLDVLITQLHLATDIYRSDWRRVTSSHKNSTSDLQGCNYTLVQFRKIIESGPDSVKYAAL